MTTFQYLSITTNIIGSSAVRNIGQKHADRISYQWDRLIESFTEHMLEGTLIALKGDELELRKNELGVRYMALVPRFSRRSYSEAISEALHKGKKEDRFFRVMMIPADARNSEMAFFILTCKYLDWMEEKGGYERYRTIRIEMAMAYSKGLLVKHPYLKRVIGIALEPPDQDRDVSQDLIYMEQSRWSSKDRKVIKRDCEKYGIFQELNEYHWQDQEYPEVKTIMTEQMPLRHRATGLNRK